MRQMHKLRLPGQIPRQKKLIGKFRFSLLFVLAWIATRPAVSADTPVMPAPSSDPRQQTVWYVCPLEGNRAFYTGKPLDILCKPAKAAPPEAASGRNAGEALQRLWYETEFGKSSDIAVLTPRDAVKAPKITVVLRHSPPPKTYKPAAPPPPPPTRAQLVRRDIAGEERALARDQNLLKAALKKGNGTEASRLQKNIADRQAGIRALRQELKLY